MRFPFLTAAIAALCFALPSAAQVQVFGGNGECAASTQILFGKDMAGGISVVHSQPEWKPEMQKEIDNAKGKLLRLGKNWWTTLSTSFDLEMGGTKVPAGSYVCGLQCDDKGNWNLALLDATKAMQSGALPFPMDDAGTMNWKPEILVPMTLNKDVAKEPVAKMTMTLKVNAKDLKQGTFTIAWGPHTMTATLAVMPKAK